MLDEEVHLNYSHGLTYDCLTSCWCESDVHVAYAMFLNFDASHGSELSSQS